MTLQSLFSLMRLTATDPQAGARRVIALDLPLQAWWQVLAVVVIAEVLLINLLMAEAAGLHPAMLLLYGNPVVHAGLQFVLVAVAAGALLRVGRAMGGRADWPAVLAVTVWSQLVLLAVQVAQIALSVVLPPLAGLLGLAVLLYMMWFVVELIVALHGFQSRLKVLLGVIGVSVGLIIAGSFLASIVFILLGLDIPASPQ